MPNSTTDKLVEAYHRMIERVRNTIEEAESKTLPNIRQNVEKARETAEELGELTHDEADRVAYYVKRDLQDAGKHLSDSGQEFADWLRFDIDRIEDHLLEIFRSVADHTRLDWLELEQELEKDPPYQSGEISGPGSLYCTACNEAVHFHQIAPIPECPRCGNTTFRRWPLEHRR